jgi:hypothetical protein
LLVSGVIAVLGLIEPQTARPAPPEAATAPTAAQIGDEPGVLTGHGPVRNTPVPGVRFRTAAPTQPEPPAERRLGGDPPIPIPFPGPGAGGGPTIPPGTTAGGGGTIPMSQGDDAGTAGGVRPTRPPR